VIPHLLTIMAIYGILAVSLNLVVGLTGLFNLGHAAFFGIGAYTSALLAFAGLPYPVCLAAAVGLPALAGVLVGLPTLRLRGDYLAMATLGFGEIARAVFRNWVALTRGPMGLPGVPHPVLLGVRIDTPGRWVVTAFAGLALAWLVAELIGRAPLGRVLRAIREDELAVQALGKNPEPFKLEALALGAGLAGLGGSLYAHYIAFVDPTPFTLGTTIFLFLLIVLGGLGNQAGSVAAAFALLAARESLRFAGLPPSISAPLQQLVFSLLLVVLVIRRPWGLLPEPRLRSAGSRRAAG
jgi:branched-chain amino acid transport system permease protein